MKILSLQIERVKRIVAVEITPDGALVILGGRNAQGKSSVLDAIAMALGGKDLACQEPLKRGAARGSVTVDLGDLVVTRSFTPRGGTLTVRSREGLAYPSPQGVLDRLCGRLAFDPLGFARARPADQLESLRKLVGLDLSAIDAERKRLEEERVLVGREGQALKGRLAGLPDEGPVERVSVSALLDDVAEAEALAGRRRSAVATAAARRAAVAAAERNALAVRQDLDELRGGFAAELVRLDGQIADLERELAAVREIRAAAPARQAHDEEIVRRDGQEQIERTEALRAEVEAGIAAAAALPVPDVAAIRARIEGAEATNARAAKAEERARFADARQAKEAEWHELTAAIHAGDAKRREALEAVTFPIAGLSLGEAGVTLDGLPFSQASHAEQIRASVAIAFASHPGLRVALVRDGSALDADSLRIVAETAARYDGQVWLERVGDGDEGAIVIEDGTVRGAKPAEPA